LDELISLVKLAGMDALVIAGGGRLAVIWLLLIVLGLLALGALTLPRGARGPRQIGARLDEHGRRRRADAERRAADAEEAVRYASEIAVAVRGATATAERRRAECQRVQAKVEQAWQAYRDADAGLERVRQASVFVTPADEIPAPERAQSLRRAAKMAYRRGNLSDSQLLDALTHRNGWDPELHPVEQELVLARAAVRHRFSAYRTTLTEEDECWRAADIATAAVHSLRRESRGARADAEAAFRAQPAKSRSEGRARPATATA
jgi:hypothetical protein